jgi:hypothetical protein
VGILLLVIVGPLLAIHYFDGAAAERALAEAIAEADRLDPGWRLEDIEAARRQIPDEKNGAFVVVSAHRKLPAKWLTTVDHELTQPPPIRLDDEVAKELRDQLKPLMPAITEARRMLQFSEGRFAITYAPIPSETFPDHHQMVRNSGFVLLLDGWHQLQNGNCEQAWKSSRAILNTGRSLGDEPLVIAQIVRMTERRIAVGLMERTLAQGAILESQLAEMQKALAEEANEPLLLRGLRGERAGTYRMFLHWEEFGISWDELPVGRAGYLKQGREWIAGKTAKLRKGNAWTLAFNTKLIEELKKPGVPLHQTLKNLGKIMVEEDKKLTGWLLFVTLPVKAEQEGLNSLHCTIAALAAERFRLQKKRWPVSLDELVKADLLKEIPIDLMDGRPLRFRRTVDGLVIYSVGADGKYRGDALDNLANFDPKQARPEFRLWDVSRRGVSK